MTLYDALRILAAIHTIDDTLGFRIVPDAKLASYEAPDYAQAWRTVRAHLMRQTERRS